MTGKLVYVSVGGKPMPEKRPDDGYLYRMVSGERQPLAVFNLSDEEMTWPLDDLAEKYPAPKVTK